MNIISHRANGFGYKENSLKGFLAALSSDAPEIEIDLRLTKDNVYVANHNPRYRHRFLKRKISKRNFEKVQFKINSLKTYLDLFEDFDNKILHLDIKDVGCEHELIKELKQR